MGFYIYFKVDFYIYMGQQEVSDFLKSNKAEWFSSTDIAKQLSVSTGSVINNLSKLRKSQQVKFKQADRINQFLYQYKH